MENNLNIRELNLKYILNFLIVSSDSFEIIYKENIKDRQTIKIIPFFTHKNKNKKI